MFLNKTGIFRLQCRIPCWMLAKINTRGRSVDRIIYFRPAERSPPCISNKISIPTGWIIMYKTVRKGDASLQYTILPQTDQFSSGGFPQASSKPRPRIIKYTMATIMVLIILSCVATPFLMNQNDHNLFASTMRAISRVEPVRNTSRNQTKNISESKNRGKISTVSTTEVTRRKDLEDGTTSFNVILRGEEEEEEAMVDDATLAGIVLF